MTLCYFLKLLSELSLLFIVADCFLSVSAVGVESLLPAVICAAIGAAGYWMEEKHSSKSKYLLPLLIIPVVLFGETFGTYAAIALGSLYVGLMIWQHRYFMDHDSQAEFFRTGMMVAGCLCIPFVMLMHFDYIAPFVLLFLMSSIFMLRLLRQDSTIFNETKFRILNLLSVISIVLLTVFISSDLFLSAAGLILGKIYSILFVPILYVIYTCGYAIYYLFIEIIFAGGWGDTTHELNMGTSMMEQMPEGLEEQLVDNSPFLMLLKGIFLIIGVLIVVLWVYKTGKGRQGRNTGTVREARTSVSMIRPEEKIYADHIAPREPRAAVRYHYRNFLRLCQNLGQEFPRHYTSQHIENMVAHNFDRETLKSMRQTYIRARYSEHDITKDDVSAIKAQVKKLKEETKTDGVRVNNFHDELRDKRILNSTWETVARGPEGNMHYNKKP